VENGITGTITDTSRDEHEHQVTIKTRENPPREVNVNTSEFHELSLAYAVHVYKAQGITTELASILTGGWQTDRESTYVALSRARDQTHIYLSREDLGQDGLDCKRSNTSPSSCNKATHNKPPSPASLASPRPTALLR
jgi:ATP-dependent exoDNAse (exonuclease V) alpha subunit